MSSTAIVPNEGKTRLLDMLVGGVGLSAVRVKLIKADFTLSKSLVYADLSFADFSGYADATPIFGSAALNSDKAEAVDSQRTFTHNGGPTANNVYGHALVDSATTKLLKVQKESSASEMAISGDTYKVTEKLSSISDPSPT